MSKRESYGPQRSPFKIFLYIIIVVLLLGGIAYLVKYTRAQRATFQEQIQELGAQETEYVQPKQSEKNTEAETESTKETKKNGQSEKAATPAVQTVTDKKETATEKASEDTTEQTTEGESETTAESESESESGTTKASAADRKLHILLLNGSGKDGMAAKWQEKLTKAGYTNVSAASFPGLAIEQTRIYVEKEEDEDNLTDLKEQFSGVEVTTDPFTAEITMEDGSAPKDVDLYIIIGKNDVLD